jgi:hypothetical protein
MPFNIGGHIYNGGIADTQDYYNIITRGLVMHLDASAPSSYPGSGTAWSNISGQSNNMTLINGPTYNSVNGGYIQFDGTDDYAQLSTSGIISNTISVDTVIYIDSVKTYAAILGSNITEKYEILIKSASDLEVSLSPNNYVQWNGILTTGTYIHLCVVATSGTGWKLYKNGVDLGAPQVVAGYTVNGTSVSTIDIGRIRNQNGFAYIGRIPNIKIYNRALSAAEVLQNFNVQRSRFGI